MIEVITKYLYFSDYQPARQNSNSMPTRPTRMLRQYVTRVRNRPHWQLHYRSPIQLVHDGVASCQRGIR